MNAPELRFRHSAPIAKHIPGKSPGPGPGRIASDNTESWIAPSTHSSQISEYYLQKSRVKWTLLGFVLGVAFWHIVGFWGFIGDIMLKGQSNSSTLMARLQKTEHSAFDATKVVILQNSAAKREITASRNATAKIEKACTQLIMDRNRQKTYAAPCVHHQPISETHQKPIQTASSNSQLDE